MTLSHGLSLHPWGSGSPGSGSLQAHVWLRRRGTHCQGGGCSRGTSVPRCCPLLMPTGHQMFPSEGRAVPRSVSESPPRAQTGEEKGCFGTTWSVGARPLPPLSSHLLSSGLATSPHPPLPKLLPLSPSVPGAGLGLFSRWPGQGKAPRQPGRPGQWCQPGAILKAAGSRAGASCHSREPAAPCSLERGRVPRMDPALESLVHSFSLPKSLPDFPMRPQGS